MVRRTNDDFDDEQINVFQAFTDLMSNAFMIISFLLFISMLQASFVNQRLDSANQKLESANQKLQSASPIIIDEKSGKFKFPSGSAELTPELRKYISTTVGSGIKKAIEKGSIDFIQVIGHTDSQGISNAGNLDSKLTLAATGNEKITGLKAGSNADLGLMRAIAVVQFLQQIEGLKKIKFRAYSAAQLYLPSGDLALQNGAADEARRRIEIRFIPYGRAE
jgi:flagellar motor protein MotB